MIPNYKSKHDAEVIVTPKIALDYRIKKDGKPNFPVPKAVIFCINWDILNHILENNDHEQVEGFFAKCYVLKKHNVLVVSKFGIGAPTTIALFEELIAYGVKKFISIGNAGAIHPTVQVGDLVVCTKAIRDEGTSHHYLPESKYSSPSVEMTEALKFALRDKGVSFHEGVSWTTDAFFRETKEEIKHYQGEGVLTVEMEAAALFAVAELRGVDVCAIFSISDTLSNLEWNPSWHAKDLHIAYEHIFEAALLTISESK